jgi:eukaryotic-like serine/threonine-protein kinase
MFRWLGRLAFLAALGAVFVISGYFAFNATVRGGVTKVPELHGLTEEEAIRILADQGLAARRAAEGLYDPQVEEGRVLRQRPLAGSLVKKDTSIELALSMGRERLRVPNLEGQAASSAQVALAGLSLPAVRLLSAFAPGPPGAVIAQQPAGGRVIDRMQTMRLVVSQPGLEDAYLMPDLVSRHLEDVRQALRSPGLHLGSVRLEPYEGVEPGIILRQFPAAGSPVRSEDLVALTVSTDAAGVLR